MESRNTYGDMDEVCMHIPSGLVRPKEASTQASVAGEDQELAELIRKNGELVTRSQYERSLRKTAIEEDAIINPVEQLSASQTREGERVANLFVQEDEVATTWLHSLPLDYCSDLYSHIVYSQPCATAVLATGSKVVSDAPTAEFNNRMQPPAMITSLSGACPPIPSSWRQKLEVSSRIRHEFSHFSSNRGSWKEAGTSGLNEPVKEFNVLESSKTPAAAVAPKYRAPSASRRRMRASTVVATSFAADIIEANNLTGSGANVTAKADSDTVPRPSMVAVDLKRKGRQIEDSNSEVIAALESLDLQNKASSKSSSSSSKRSRCAEVHSLSEKKRRERINERMKVLQELIPRSNKLDKASLLDEAIEYLKSLQLQVQIMSMGYSIAPIMFPGIQLYTPMTTPPLMQFPRVVPDLNLLNPTQLGPRFPLPAAFQIPISDPSRVQAISPLEHRMNTTTVSVDSHQQHYGVGQTPNTSRPDQGIYDQHK